MLKEIPNPAELGEHLGQFFAERPEFEITSAYLFGSHAAGRAHRESDVDVAVLLPWDRYPDRRDRFDLRLLLSGRLERMTEGRPVDLVILNDVPPLLGRHVVYQGQRIFCADPEADRAYTLQVQLRAADLEPWLRRYRRLQLEALGV